MKENTNKLDCIKTEHSSAAKNVMRKTEAAGRAGDGVADLRHEEDRAAGRAGDRVADLVCDEGPASGTCKHPLGLSSVAVRRRPQDADQGSEQTIL